MGNSYAHEHDTITCDFNTSSNELSPSLSAKKAPRRGHKKPDFLLQKCSAVKLVISTWVVTISRNNNN